MGHLGNMKAEYRALQQRHAQGPAALPSSELMYEALHMLYTEDEARLAAVMPWRPVSARHLARRTGEPEEDVRSRLERMADKGIVFDLVDPSSGKTRYVLTPPVVGFVEFSMMRVRDDIDQKRMAQIWDSYLTTDRSFADAMFSVGHGQLGRALVHEDAVAEAADFCEVLDYEKASALIAQAGGGALSLCHCRHTGEHVGKPCTHRLDNCTSLLPAADYVIRRGFGRRAEPSELLEVLAQAREAGLVQIADNVQRRPSYICHCCSCHCGQLLAISRFGLKQAVHTSSRIAHVDAESCTACGACVDRCPIQALALVDAAAADGQSADSHAVVDETLCLGCGVCHAACPSGALTMPARAERVLTPETTLERILLRAVDTGSVHHVLFGSEDNLTMAFLHRVLGVIERMPPTRALLLNQQLRSKFVGWLLSEGRRQTRGAI